MWYRLACHLHDGVTSLTGSGPGVVLIHHLGGDQTVWKDEAPRLAKTHTILNVELPGHGKSPAPEHVDFDEIARQVTQVIRKDGLAPAVGVGHSIGGTLAASSAPRNIKRVHSQVLGDRSLTSWCLSRLFPSGRMSQRGVSLRRQ